MSNHFAKALKLRDGFKIVNKDILQWFPGHMDKGMKQMQQRLKMVDCIIEVHDSRIPFSGRNHNFQSTICAIRPHILVLNKKDLTDPSQNPKVIAELKKQKLDHVIYTNCKDQSCKGVTKLFPLMEDLILKSDRYNRDAIQEHVVMIIGVPNVGKSSLINALRNRYLSKGNASPVGGVAGVTRSVLHRIKISEKPPVFMLDTPGILTPSVENLEMGLKLALCSCLPDHLVGQDVIADYLLYWLNRFEKYQYVELMGLNEPTDDITEVLNVGAVKLDKYKILRQPHGGKKLMPDVLEAARVMIKAFRKGDLGRLFLDRDRIAESVKSG